MVSIHEELMDELDSFNPKWREIYSSVGTAAGEAGVLNLYNLWLVTPTGEKYMMLRTSKIDWIEYIRREKLQIEADRALGEAAKRHEGRFKPEIDEDE